MSLTKQLKELGKAVMELTDGQINYGGCGVYASAVARRLEALGLEVECVTPVDGWDDVGSVEEARNNLQGNGCDPSNAEAQDWWSAGLNGYHVGVRFKHDGQWYTHDTEATRKGRGRCGRSMAFDCTPDGLTPDEAWAMADSPRGWNSSFPRDLIPEVRALVEEYLQ